MTAASLAAAVLRLAAPVAASDRVHDARTSLFLTLESGGVVGVGECATASLDGTDATTDAVLDALDELARHGVLAAPVASVDALLDDAGAPVGDRAAVAASALLAAARLDLALRREGLSLAGALGVRATAVRFAGVLGVAPPDRTAERARALLALGATRLRLKHAPGSGTAALDAVLRTAGTVPVVLDANGAFVSGRDDAELDALCARPLAWVEQPFGIDDLGAHAALAARGVRVGLDESVTALDVVERAAALGISVVCVKPTRVGGLAVSRALLARAAALGVEAYVGGLFEAGLGRAALGALAAASAALPGALDGDVAGPAAYLADDPCGLAPPAGGTQPLFLGPGCGPHPAPARLTALRAYGGAPDP